MLPFTRISTASPYFAEAMSIYHTAFPVAEQHAPEKLKKRLDLPQSELWVNLEGERAVFMAVLWRFESTDYLFLDYLAVAESHRGRGIGTAFIRFLQHYYVQKGLRIILEIEHPDFGDNRTERLRRWHFYRQLGAKYAAGVHSMVPPIQTDEYTDTLLLFFGEKSSVIKGNVLRNLVVQLFSQIYHRNEADAFTQGVLQTIGEKVFLSDRLG
jgi:GNAT superfamily N-acetyltransferase